VKQAVVNGCPPSLGGALSDMASTMTQIKIASQSNPNSVLMQPILGTDIRPVLLLVLNMPGVLIQLLLL
jgi:hypothetical protein